MISLVQGLTIAALLVSSAAAAEDTARCLPLYAQLTQLDPNLGSAYQKLLAIRPELINGTAQPKKEDFEALESILNLIQEGKSEVQTAGKDEELKKLLTDLAQAAPTDNSLRALAAKKAKPVVTQYRPTEYELKVYYQKKLAEIERELPKNLRFPLPHIPFDQRMKTLLPQAQQLMKEQEERFEKLFPTTGYANLNEFVAAANSAGERAQILNQALQNEQVDVVIRQPEYVRFWIPKAGFLNQHVTGTSRGYMGDKARNYLEASLTGRTYEDLSKMDNALKPVYATIYPKPQIGTSVHDGLNHYGADTYVFKLDRIRNFLTWTPGDSLNRLGVIFPFSTIAVHEPASWDQLFVPWKYRALAAPEFYSSGTNFKVLYSGPKNGWNSDEAKALSKFTRSIEKNVSDYLEVQIFKPGLDLDDVAEFYFQATSAEGAAAGPPSGEFLKELLKRKIKIRQQMPDGSLVDWTPPSP